MGCYHSKKKNNEYPGPIKMQDLERELQPVNYPINNIPPKFCPQLTEGYVCKVYDADTITVVSKLDFKSGEQFFRFSIRLIGIDAPELRTKNETEKKIAIQGRDELRKIILYKVVTLKTYECDKYGRLLCEVYYNGIHLNKWLLDEHYAVCYDGGRKETPHNWEEYRNNRQLKD